MAAARGAGDIGTDVDHGERLADVRRYFDSRESRWGYTLLLKGRKHFGYYPDDGGHPAVARAQELMEDRLADRLGVPEGSRVLDAGSGEGIV
ncbi:MAG TPA: hypothetical protein VF743_12105, partial [Acidimicrobiales bacterium]